MGFVKLQTDFHEDGALARIAEDHGHRAFAYWAVLLAETQPKLRRDKGWITTTIRKFSALACDKAPKAAPKRAVWQAFKDAKLVELEGDLGGVFRVRPTKLAEHHPRGEKNPSTTPERPEKDRVGPENDQSTTPVCRQNGLAREIRTSVLESKKKKENDDDNPPSQTSLAADIASVSRKAPDAAAVQSLIELRAAELGRDLTQSEQLSWFWRPVAKMVVDHGRDAVVYAVGEATSNAKPSADWILKAARGYAARQSYTGPTRSYDDQLAAAGYAPSEDPS